MQDLARALVGNLYDFNPAVDMLPIEKTNKSIDVMCWMLERPQGPVTVSTPREAQDSASHGIADILYVVGITPNKLAHVLALRAAGVQLAIIVDNQDVALVVVAAAEGASTTLDGDAGDRLRLSPGPDPARVGGLRCVADALGSADANLRGVMTHAGSSYNCRSMDVHPRRCRAGARRRGRVPPPGCARTPASHAPLSASD